jgi:hypothetical protein
MITALLARLDRWRARRELARHHRWRRRNRVLMPKPRLDPRDWQQQFERQVRP